MLVIPANAGIQCLSIQLIAAAGMTARVYWRDSGKRAPAQATDNGRAFDAPHNAEYRAPGRRKPLI
ncbi:hypothetical protein ACF3M1_09995 [Luteimonas sp. WGS1318]|uniref:hypothetical protein n=1 Tax=Luteimonas sp. WGS1318 TaxID=3366815 RepID=UPI00372CEA88